MFLDYSKIRFDSFGRPEQPELMLQTLDGKSLGTIPGVHELKINVKLAEPSEMSFKIPKVLDGADNPMYEEVVGYRRIYTEYWGIYVVMNPKTTGDGIEEVKEVQCYSLEKLLETKIFFLEPDVGYDNKTWRFYNPDDIGAGNYTIMGRILKYAPDWKLGTMSDRQRDMDRTFDAFSDSLLTFVGSTAPEKFECIFVFDPYAMEINVLDAKKEEIQKLPIYLDYENLVEDLEIEEKTDELVTSLYMYGADDLDILYVNPSGEKCIRDLSYFIANGDISGSVDGEDIVEKYERWQYEILNAQDGYRGVVAMWLSVNNAYYSGLAKIDVLNDQLKGLEAAQSAYIQDLNMYEEKTKKYMDDGVVENIENEAYEAQKDHLSTATRLVEEKEKEIEDQRRAVEALKAEYDQYNSMREDYVERLKYEIFFTEKERRFLDRFIIEKSITDDNFVASDSQAINPGEIHTLEEGSISIEDADLLEVNRSDVSGATQRIFLANGGKISITGKSTTTTYEYVANSGVRTVTSKKDFTVEGKAMYNASIVLSEDGTVAFSCRIGTGTFSEDGTVREVKDGVFSIRATASGVSSDITETVVDTGTTYQGTEVQLAQLKGSWIRFSTSSGDMYATEEATDYAIQSVAYRLYEKGVEYLDDLAVPTYEFEVSTGNFLFEKHFEPFRNSLQLAKGIYLNVGNGLAITPYLIEVTVDYDDWSKLDLVFSNRFKRHDSVNTLKDMLDRTFSSSSRFDASSYSFVKTSSKMTTVAQIMQDAMRYAVDLVLNARDQSVVIDDAGIHVRSLSTNTWTNPNEEVRIINNMICFTNDSWQTAKVAIGKFVTDQLGEMWGINAEVVMGKMIIGQDLWIEAQKLGDGDNPDVVSFRVNGEGAFLNNAAFVLQSTKTGNKIIIDPSCGIAAGLGTGSGRQLYTLKADGSIQLSFMDEDGEIIWDDTAGLSEDEKFPKNTNFFLDIHTGDAYFRGKVKATSGIIGGFHIEENKLWSNVSDAAYVGMCGGVKELATAEYAFWCGSENPKNAPFWVKKNGDMRARNGIFTGKISNYLAAEDEDAWLLGCGIATGGTVKYTDSEKTKLSPDEPPMDGYKFYVDKQGNCTLAGNIYMNGNIQWNLSGEGAANTTNFLYDTLANDNTKFGIFNTSDAGLVVKSNYIIANTAVADDFQVANKIGGMTVSSGQSGSGSTTKGVMIYRSKDDTGTAENPNYYIIVTDAGVRLTSPNARIYVEQNAAHMQYGAGTTGLKRISVNSAGLNIGDTSNVTQSNIYGDVYIYDDHILHVSGDTTIGSYTEIQDDLYVTGTIYVDGDVNCGGSVIDSSDRRTKNSISYDMERYEDLFMRLKPSRFRKDTGTSGRFHTGFIAQDVEEAIYESGLDTSDFAAFVVKEGDESTDYEDRMALRYQEFVALNTHMIQKQQDMIEKMSKKIEKLEARIAELEGRA